jgi:RecA/RadA recombinase
MDENLKGGIELGNIIEFCGVPGVGKQKYFF